MSKKVLVLCQRKKGFFYNGREGYKEIEDEIVPKINRLTDSLLTEPYKIDYLSSLEGQHKDGEVDIKGVLSFKEGNGVLSFQNKKYKNDYYETIATKDFIDQNEGSYALIILNTCPFIFMEFSIIHKLLAPDGLMIFAAYPRPISNKFNIEEVNKIFSLDEELTNRFPEVLIYSKKKSPTPKKRSSTPKKRSSTPKKKSPTPKKRSSSGGKKMRKTRRCKKVLRYFS